MRERVTNKRGVELPKILKTGDEVVYVIESNKKNRINIFRINKPIGDSMLLDNLYKYEVSIVKSWDAFGNVVEKFGEFSLNQLFIATLNHDNITAFVDGEEKTKDDDFFNSEWENA